MLIGHWKLRGDCRGQPLRIGFGQTDYFLGRIADVRLYKGALTEDEI